MTDFGGGTVAVVGHGLNDHGNAAGAIALIDGGLKVIRIAGAERLLDGALNVVVRHIGSLGLCNDCCKTGIVRGIAAAAFFHGNDHFTGDLGERLCALGVLRTFGFLYIMPLGMSGHGSNSSCKNA